MISKKIGPNTVGINLFCSSYQISDVRFRMSDSDINLIFYMQDVDSLIIYKNALSLISPIYRLVELLPGNEFKLKSQTREAAKSIAPLIAEGFAKKRSQNEFKRFLLMALGSSDEVITHLREIKILQFDKIKPETCDKLIEYYKIESKQINRMISIIITNQNPTSDI